MMAQWHACKASAPDAILFFRLGDFYEAFHEDAELISRELDLTLTKRQEIPMAGVPHHICDAYIDKLVAKGYRVAIAEQMEDPKETKGIVKREIVRIVTPGTVINSALVEDKKQNFVACIVQLNQIWSLAFLDITTADFYVAEFEKKEALFDELSRIEPKELIVSSKWKENQPELVQELRQILRPTFHFLSSTHFDHQIALHFLCKHFDSSTLDRFGLKGMVGGINAAGALLAYVQEELKLPIDHIRTLSLWQNQQYMMVDKTTQRHLELTAPLHHGQKEATLLYWIDETKTPMGGRLLRKWLLHPLLSVEEIRARQDAIEALFTHFPLLLEIRRHLAEVQDLERLLMKIETGFASPRDLVALRLSLEQVPPLSEKLKTIQASLLKGAIEAFSDTSSITDTIARALVDQPPLRLSDGGTFKRGYDPELDELLTIKADSNEWIANYQTHLRETLGIKTIKIGYTKAFGYFIEVSRAQADKIPPTFHRRQTLVTGERFISEELKNFEYKILSADEKIAVIETRLFLELRELIKAHAEKIRLIAQSIGQIDCFASLARVAKERSYVRPLVDQSDRFDIKAGRHPVVEAGQEESFIPNDTKLDNLENQLAIITGPNMAGKSTFIRQAALLALLAQMGSFIPAKSAHIGIIDRLFSRIGASDDLTRGQSTFMVEMTETANILHHATDRSLIILDEIGRGTSTYDGISIAWAVAEFLLNTPGKKAKTLFATHYFELTALAQKYPSAFNLNVAVEEADDTVVFLRQIRPGIADKSYGIHVARLAGLPQKVLISAQKKLQELERLPKSNPKQLELL